VGATAKLARPWPGERAMLQILFYAAYGITLVGAAALTWWSFAS
jgi:hypothetical protein